MTALLALLLLQTNLDRAQSLLREGRVSEARAAADAAVREQPESVAALMLQGRAAMAQNDFALARTALARAAALAPRSASAQFMLGFFHYVDNDFVQARPALERARKLKPDDPRTVLFLALTYEGLAEPQRAEELFQETLRVEAGAGRRSVETHIAYARMLFAGGRFEEAQAQVTHALKLDAEAREALYEQARLEFERGRFAECIAHAERALARPGDGVTERQIHFLLSRAWSRKGDSARAEFHRQRFEAIPPRLIR